MHLVIVRAARPGHTEVRFEIRRWVFRVFWWFCKTPSSVPWELDYSRTFQKTALSVKNTGWLEKLNVTLVTRVSAIRKIKWNLFLSLIRFWHVFRVKIEPFTHEFTENTILILWYMEVWFWPKKEVINLFYCICIVICELTFWESFFYWIYVLVALNNFQFECLILIDQFDGAKIAQWNWSKFKWS